MVFMVSCSSVIHGATMIQPPLCPSSGSGLASVTREVKIISADSPASAAHRGATAFEIAIADAPIEVRSQMMTVAAS